MEAPLSEKPTDAEEAPPKQVNKQTKRKCLLCAVSGTKPSRGELEIKVAQVRLIETKRHFLTPAHYASLAPRHFN